MYRGHRKGSGGPPGGATPPGGPHGLRGAGSQPLVGWAHPLPWALAPRVEGGNPRGGAPLAWGASHPLPLSPWPPPHPRWVLEGPAPFSLPPINRGVRGGQPHPLLGAALSSSIVCLAKPCRSTASPPSPRRRAAGGAVFLNLSFPLAGSRRRRRPRAVRVLNAEAPSVRR